jgi:uncharacterized membrane protein
MTIQLLSAPVTALTPEYTRIGIESINPVPEGLMNDADALVHGVGGN